MTDETRPPSPDGEQSGPPKQDDALDSWFRPRTIKHEQPAAEAGVGETSVSGVSAENESGDGAGGAERAERAGGGESVDGAGLEDVGGGGVEAPDQAQTQVVPAFVDNDVTQLVPRTPSGPDELKAAEAQAAEPKVAEPEAAEPKAVEAEPGQGHDAGAPTELIPPTSRRSLWPAESDMAVRGDTAPAPAPAPREGSGPGRGEASSWSPAPDPRQAQSEQEQVGQGQPYRPAPPTYQETPSYQQAPPYQNPQQRGQTRPFQASGPRPSILPGRSFDEYDDFYDYDDGEPERPRSRARRALLVTAGVAVLVVAVVAALAFTGKINVPGIAAKPVPTVGFSPSGSDAGSDATQTGTAFLTDWQNGSLQAAANITDDPSAALAQLTAYKKDLKVSGLTLLPGTASAQGWMTFNATAQVGTPAGAWSYSSGLATYSANVNGYTRWFVKWQPSVMFTSLKNDQKLALGLIPPTANKVLDRNGTEITGANAPSLNGIVGALKKSAPAASGTPGQQVQIENADGSVDSTVAKVSDPVATSALKTTLDLKIQATAQAAVNQAPNSSMVVIQPSTGNILAVANNPPNGLDTAMVGRYAPGSTFKTITTTLVLNKGVITDLNQNWDCPQVLNADGITLHNSEQEGGGGESFLWDFAQSCNNAFSRFEGKVSRSDLASTAHDYFGFNQKWDVGLNSPTTYGNVPDNPSNSLAEELVGQDQITASPLTMASVAATIANGSFKQPILVPGTTQISATPLPAATDQSLKTLMHEVVASGTLAGVFNGQPGVYGKTGTAEVQGKQPNSWTIAFKGDYAAAALAVGGGFGASTAGPEVSSVLKSVS